MDTHGDMLAKLFRVEMLLFCHRVIRKIMLRLARDGGAVDVVVGVLHLKLPGLSGQPVCMYPIQQNWMENGICTATTTKG